VSREVFRKKHPRGMVAEPERGNRTRLIDRLDFLL